MNVLQPISLVSEEKTKDKVGQTITTRTLREVIGTVDSVYQSEFFRAEEAGIRPQFRILVSSFDYNNEDKVVVNNKEYSIYRTFMRGTDRIELYVGERVGNTVGSN